MTLWIHLVRHGRSALARPSRWITPAEFRDWIAQYDRAGISAESIPSEDLIAIAAGAPAVVCSDSPRSIESAARLAPGSQPRVSPAFREVGRPLPSTWTIRLPLETWDRLSVVLWKWNVIRTDEPFPAARRRAREATRELIDLAQASSQVVVVGHGTLNAMVARELLRHNWHGPRRVGEDHWSVGSFSIDT